MIWPNSPPQSMPQTTDWDVQTAETWAPPECRIRIDTKRGRFLSSWPAGSLNRPKSISWGRLGSQTLALKVLLRHLWSCVDETISSSHKWIYHNEPEEDENPTMAQRSTPPQ